MHGVTGGGAPGAVAKLTVYVVDHDMSKLGVLTQSVKEMLGDAWPAQLLVPVPKLAIDPMLFEVEAVVVFGVVALHNPLLGVARAISECT